MSFRTQLTLLIGLVAAIVVTAILLVTNALMTRHITRDQGEALQALSKSTSAMLAEGLHERMREIELLARSQEVLDHVDDAPRITAILNRTQQTHPQYSWIGLAAPEGAVRMATKDMLVGKDVHTRPWFQQGGKSPVVGDVHEAKLLAKMLPPSENGEPIRFVDFSAPIHDGQGRLIGVLGAHENWDWARQVVRSLRDERMQAQGVDVFVIDHNGNVIHRPDGTAGKIEPLDHRAWPAQHQMMPWSDHHPYLTAASKVAHGDARVQLGWTVVVRQPKHLALHAAEAANRTIVIVGAISTVLAMLLAWWLAGRVSKPLQRLSAVAKRIEGGDLSADLPDTAGSSEMRDLIASLSGMTGALLNNQHALEQANATLEQRVKERTDELERANAELVILARRDGLTGLFNRRTADDRLSEEHARHTRYKKSMSLLLVDIDHFKKINDVHGHAMGDEALKAVAQCLERHSRGSDFIARFGGEEFLLLLPETALEGAVQAAEKLRQAVSDLAIPEVGRITISTGVAQSKVDGSLPIAAMLQQADEALYEAKAQGRNRVVAYGTAAAMASLTAVTCLRDTASHSLVGST